MPLRISLPFLSQLLILLAYPFISTAQVNLQISPMVGDSEVMLNTQYSVTDVGLVTFTKIRFYLGNAVKVKDKSGNDIFETKYFLIDSEKKSSCLVELPTNVSGYNKIPTIWIGVDSFTSNSGVYSGALDPINGMYWTWQSGYVSIKIEGKIVSKDGKINAFEYHLGGYQLPYAVSFPLDIKGANEGLLKVGIDMARFIKLSQGNFPLKILSPGKDAFLLGKLFSESFFVRNHD